MHRPPAPPAPILVVGAVASVQIGSATATRLFPDVGPGGAVLLRLVASAILLLAVSRPAVRTARRRDLGLAASYGLVLALMNLSFYLAIARIPLGIAVTIEFLGPLAVAVSGSRRLLDLLWVGLAALGVVLLAGSGGRLDLVGILLAALAGCFWGTYILLAQQVGRVFSGAGGLAVALTVGTVVVAPYGIVTGGTALLRPSVVGRGVAVAVLSSAVPYSLELAALRRMRASAFGVLMSLEPAMAALSGLVFLGQRLALHDWLAVVSVMIASIGATRRPGAPEPAEVPVPPESHPPQGVTEVTDEVTA